MGELTRLEVLEEAMTLVFTNPSPPPPETHFGHCPGLPRILRDIALPTDRGEASGPQLGTLSGS